MRKFFAFTLAALGTLAAGCDNVGRAFDRTVTPGDPTGPVGEVIVEEVPSGGDARDGRPKVKAVFPKGGGWPVTVPVVVEFSESVNQTSIAPTTPTGIDGRIILRVVGTTTALPCQYNFLAGGRILVMRPTPTLSNAQNPSYEVVLLPDARDCDGVRFVVDEGGESLAEFQVNQDESITDGRILTTFPRDNLRDATREGDYLVVFDRPANAATLPANVMLRPQGGTALAGDVDVPLKTVGVDDPRIVSFDPASALAASTRYELVVNSGITFGVDGQLDFRGRTPFATFDTIGPAAPTAVTLANPSAGYPGKINRNNATAAFLRVQTPADAQVGDRIVARIYGGDKATAATNDTLFKERTFELVAAGQQDVDVDFTGQLGTLAAPKLDDGSITFAVQMRRGSQQSGFIHQAESLEPRFDVTAPTLTQAGSVGATGGDTTEFRTDQEQLVLFGTASEEIGAADLASNSLTATLYASAADGRFVMRPILLGRNAGPVAYSLLLTDTAGNMAAAAVTGNVRQRGMVTGALAGTLTVEAFDDATLLPIAGATVLVDPGLPSLPAAGQLMGTTDATGRAVFTGVVSSTHTVTIVRAGYDLVTFYGTAAAHVSLPLRPIANATATFNGTVVFTQSPGTTVLVGNSAFDDSRVLAAATTSAAPTAIPNTAIRPSRPQLITAFGGSFEPTAAPTFSQIGYQMLGPTLLEPTPPAAPAAPGDTSRQTMAMIASTGSVGLQAMSHTVDFALANGLDTANLVGGQPIVRAMMALSGFGGQVLNGVGFPVLQSGSSFAITWNYGLTAAIGLGIFTPFQWVVTEARDSSARISRHRALFLGTLFNLVPTPPSIPVITAPAGPATGSPLVEYADVVDRTVLTDARALSVITVTDAAARSWRLYVVDNDAASGTNQVQFPDLQTANVAGLATGTWSAVAETRLFYPIPGTGNADFVLSEHRRQELHYSRSAPQTVVVQ